MWWKDHLPYLALPSFSSASIRDPRWIKKWGMVEGLAAVSFSLSFLSVSLALAKIRHGHDK